MHTLHDAVPHVLVISSTQDSLRVHQSAATLQLELDKLRLMERTVSMSLSERDRTTYALRTSHARLESETVMLRCMVTDLLWEREGMAQACYQQEKIRQYLRLLRCFERVDRNRDGVVSLEEVMRMMQRREVPVTKVSA